MGKARVLIVDDNATNRKLAEVFIGPYGVQMDFAAGGREAVGLVSDRHYDIIFMDHMMPDMDGMEATKAIRTMEGGRFGEIPILAMTASDGSDAREKFLAGGFSEYIVKPLDRFKIKQAMEEWLPRGGSGDEGLKAGAGLPGGGTRDGISIEGLDTDKGIYMTGGTLKGYLEILNLYRVGAEAYLKDFPHFPEAGGLREYIVRIHALKSASASIGATSLSCAAAAMEKAGKEGDLETLIEKKGVFDRDLSITVEHIRSALARDKRDY